MNVPENVREIYSRYLSYTAGETFSFGKGAFAENKWVWIPQSKDKYSIGEIIGESGAKNKIRTQEGEEITMDKEKVELFLMNPPKFDGVPDNSELSNLSEPAVLHNLKKRYESDIIYVSVKTNPSSHFVRLTPDYFWSSSILTKDSPSTILRL